MIAVRLNFFYYLYYRLFVSNCVLISGFYLIGASEPNNKLNLCISKETEYTKYINESQASKNSSNYFNRYNYVNSNKCVNTSTKTLKANLTHDGYLVTTDNVFYPPDDFCIERNEKLARICEPNKTIWKKCCPENELWNPDSKTCQGSSIPFRPIIGMEFQPFEVQRQRRFGSSHAGPIICPEGYELKSLVPENCNVTDPAAKSRRYDASCATPAAFNVSNHCMFQITNEGVKFQSPSGLFHRIMDWRLLQHDMYCVEGIFNNSLCHLISPYNKVLQEKCADSLKEILFFCDPSGRLVSSSEEQGPEKAYCLATIWLSTCPLLVTAALANLFVIQKNVHGWTLSCYLMSMFFVNINSAILALEDQANGCRIIDISMKFLYLSTLCWMTTINFGLWRTFRLSLPKQVEPRRFVVNCLFSMIFPAIVVTISYLVGKKYTCGNQYCALYSHETFPYFSGPVILLILTNLVLFLRTTLIIAKLRRETSTVLRKESKDNLESFRLFAKLFLMTGSIWILRVILLFLQLKGLYFTWYGVLLEAFFSIPEAAFSIMVLLHPELVKWAWKKSPTVSRKISKFIPCFDFRPTINLEMGSKTQSIGNTPNTTITNKSPSTSVR